MSNYPKYDKYTQANKKKNSFYYEIIATFFQNTNRIMKVANKPSRKDYFLVFKICAIGIVLLGAVSYVLQLIFSIVPLG